VKRAFAYYEKAIELNPEEPVYKQNFATTIYLFRKDAQEFYRINEQQVFDRALDLYQQAMKLDPTNLVLAVDYAQSYYGIKPMRTNDAIAAWKHALTLAKNTDEEQGLFLHLARVELNTGNWNEALVHLNSVTNVEMIELKQRLEKNWIQKRDKALGVTNSAEALASASPAKIN
jgi:tetratricopeptide (TPR) repeat protein